MSREMDAYLDDLFGPWLDEAVARLRIEILETGWDDYMKLVVKLEDHPENRPGADKSWVERTAEINRLHYRNAVQVPPEGDNGGVR